jgi:hypothetical protein
MIEITDEMVELVVGLKSAETDRCADAPLCEVADHCLCRDDARKALTAVAPLIAAAAIEARKAGQKAELQSAIENMLHAHQEWLQARMREHLGPISKADAALLATARRLLDSKDDKSGTGGAGNAGNASGNA